MSTDTNTSYKKLILYQKAKALVLAVYDTTTNYLKTETFTLVPQMRRASVSVLANIVEDCAKESSAEFARFLTISIGSITELEVSIELSLDLNFIKQQQFDKMYGLLIETKKLLYVSRRTVRYRRS